MAPYDFASIAGSATYYLIFLLIGAGFGATLEMSGFGDSRKLAAQFYLRDLTVLKVMFTGIIVASTLIFLSTSLGLLDFDRVWVNPTYLWPGIVGGLIMGVGFILGGFCPGTSLVAASTLKVDGVFFVLGVGTGVWLFGESVGSFQEFFVSSFMGRFTLPEWLGIPTGVVLVLLVLMALGMFFGGEIAERVFGNKEKWWLQPRSFQQGQDGSSRLHRRRGTARRRQGPAHTRTALGAAVRHGRTQARQPATCTSTRPSLPI